MKYKAAGFKDTNQVFEEISDTRFNSIASAKATCLTILELEEKFYLLLNNFAEFEFELLRLAETSLIWKHGGLKSSMIDRLLLERRLVNLLTSCRLYLDQSDHDLSTLFGNPSQELASIKKHKNKIYDEHWGYRLMEALRNHVQHAGLPIHLITYTQEASDPQDFSYATWKVVPQSKYSSLVENKSFKKSVLNELKSKDELIDLRGPIREYITCLIGLHATIRKTVESRFLKDRETYQTAVKEHSKICGISIQFPRFYEFDEKDNPTQKIELVTEFLDYYEDLLIKNRVHSDLRKLSVSNSDQKPRY